MSNTVAASRASAVSSGRRKEVRRRVSARRRMSSRWWGSSSWPRAIVAGDIEGSRVGRGTKTEVPVR